jgi:hypothetical protein
MNAPKIVASGSWLYAESALLPVFIVRTGYDFWYEVARADGTLEEGEVPDLDENGNAYYVLFHRLRDDGTFWPDSGSHRSLDDAKTEAETRVPSPIRWRQS